MRYNIKYLDSKNLIIVETSGDMTGNDFVIMAEEILSHSNYQPNKNVLFDHRELNFGNASIQDIEKIRNYHKENENKIGSGKSAIVVKPELLSEWNRFWEQGEKIKTNNIVKVFDSIDNATNWIKE